MNTFRILLTASLMSVPLFACTTGDADGPEYVQANNPVESDLGYFTLELEPADGAVWPDHTGPTALALHIHPGPDPLPPDPELGAAMDLLPPLVLTLGEARPWEGPGGPMTVTAPPDPVTPDGFKWTTVVDFKAAGDWVVPVTVTDAADRSDSIEIVFHVE